MIGTTIPGDEIDSGTLDHPRDRQLTAPTARHQPPQPKHAGPAQGPAHMEEQRTTWPFASA